MKTWTVVRRKAPDGTWSVFVNERLVESGLREAEAAHAVQAWTPPPTQRKGGK